jgi:hypothetical protein
MRIERPEMQTTDLQRHLRTVQRLIKKSEVGLTALLNGAAVAELQAGHRDGLGVDFVQFVLNGDAELLGH